MINQATASNGEFPLERLIFIHYRPSPGIGIFNAFARSGAIFCLFLAEIPIALKGLIGICLAVHYLYQVKSYLRLANGQTNLCLKLDRQNRWQLIRDNDETIALDLLPGPFVHPFIVVLRFKDETGQTSAYAVTPDNLDRQTLRRLRARLRFPLISSP